MSAEAGRIRILAVDDHPIVRQGIAGLVAVHSDMSLVAEASNGREVIQQFRAQHPDVTLMDLQMPEISRYLLFESAERTFLCWSNTLFFRALKQSLRVKTFVGTSKSWLEHKACQQEDVGIASVISLARKHTRTTERHRAICNRM
jgi:CheY-like chemotaxis protein